MLVRVKVNQARHAPAASWQPARISLDAYPDLQFQGRGNRSHAVGTSEHADDPRAQLRLRLSAFQEATEARARPLKRRSTWSSNGQTIAIIVPATPLCMRKTGFTVRVLDGGTVRSAPVTLGAKNDTK